VREDLSVIFASDRLGTAEVLGAISPRFKEAEDARTRMCNQKKAPGTI